MRNGTSSTRCQLVVETDWFFFCLYAMFHSICPFHGSFSSSPQGPEGLPSGQRRMELDHRGWGLEEHSWKEGDERQRQRWTSQKPTARGEGGKQKVWRIGSSLFNTRRCCSIRSKPEDPG